MSMDQTLRYARQQRVRLIDFLLSQYGHVNRSALVEFFDISMPQASADFALYQKMAPGNMTYSPSERRYNRLPTFQKVYP